MIADTEPHADMSPPNPEVIAMLMKIHQRTMGVSSWKRQLAAIVGVTQGQNSRFSQMRKREEDANCYIIGQRETGLGKPVNGEYQGYQKYPWRLCAKACCSNIPTAQGIGKRVWLVR